MNDVNTMLYMLVQKQLNLNLELNQKRKENLTKIKNPSGKWILKRKLKYKRRDIDT